MIYTYSKNHRIPCFYSTDIAKYVTVPQSKLDNLCTPLLYFTGSGQNALFYANAVVQPSVQHYSCYMAWKTKDHTWCRYCHLCINAPMWREKRWLHRIIDPPSYNIMFTFKVGVNHGIFHVYHFWNFLIFKCTWVCSSSSSKNKNIFLNLSINSINLKMSIYLSISKMCSSLFRGEIKLARV